MIFRFGSFIVYKMFSIFYIDKLISKLINYLFCFMGNEILSIISMILLNILWVILDEVEEEVRFYILEDFILFLIKENLFIVLNKDDNLFDF